MHLARCSRRSRRGSTASAPPGSERAGAAAPGLDVSEAEEEELFGPFGEDDKVKHLFAAIHVQSAWRRKEAMRRVQLAKIRARKHKGNAGRQEDAERRLLKSASMRSDRSSASHASSA